MSNDMKCLPKLLLTVFDALCDVTSYEEVAFVITFTNVFFCYVFYVFNVFKVFI